MPAVTPSFRHEAKRVPSTGARRARLLPPLVLAALAACGDVAPPSAPIASPEPRLAAQPLKGTWTVTTLDEPGEGSCTSSYCTLRQAVAAAQDGDRIVFKSTLRGTIKLASSLQLGKPLQIDGGRRITLDTEGRDIVASVFSEGVELSGVTLTGGTLGAINVLSGSLTLRSSTVTGNTSVLGGGGIRSLGSLTVINSSIVGNQTSQEGGGIWASGGPLTVIGSTIADNDADDYGGGIYVSGAAAATSITASTISGNSGFVGGGIFNNVGSVTIRSSVIVSNSSPGAGGGVGAESAGGERATILLANSIIAGNGGDCYINSTESTIQSLGHTLSSTGDLGCFYYFPTWSAASDVLVDASLLFTEVLEAQLKNNGGPTATHALIERGWAVDAGYCPGALTDQRGATRPYDDSRMPNALDGCDIGAFEWAPAATTGRRK